LTAGQEEQSRAEHGRAGQRGADDVINKKLYAGYPSMTMFNPSPQRVEHNVISTKLYSYNLVLVVIRICTIGSS
jgi:hypothetical protein